MNHAIVGSYGVTIPIKARQIGQFLKRQLLANSDRIVSSRSKTMIPLLPLPLQDDRDILFYPATVINLTLYTHIINQETLKLLVKNTSNRPLRISRQQKLDHIVNIRYNNCFLTDTKSAF